MAAGTRPDLHEEARLGPGAADAGGGAVGAAILVARHDAGARVVEQVVGGEEDGAVEVRVEAEVLVGSAAVVQAQRLGRGQRE